MSLNKEPSPTDRKLLIDWSKLFKLSVFDMNVFYGKARWGSGIIEM